MWSKIKNFFRQKQPTPQPLRIEGVRIELTPQPDDAEVAAEALLKSLSQKADKDHKPQPTQAPPEQGTPAYYRRLSDRIREDRETETRLALRFVAYCEQELHSPLLPTGRIAGLERELYQRIDIVEREGGELKRRWQHCLADITVRLMNHE